MTTTLHTLLGTEWPLIQAPMAGVQDAALTVAVCEAGALGSLPAALLSPQALREAVAAIRQGTQRPFNLNFFCHSLPPPDPAAEHRWQQALAPYYRQWGLSAEAVGSAPTRRPFDEDAAALLEAVRPRVVSFHFGLPAPALLQRVRALGITVMSSATTVAEALWLARNGADIVIAQGLEAGGHRGHFLSDDLHLHSGTFALLPQVVRAVDVPVVAAGGIADARGVSAALALGAAGVQVGTAFLCADEARTSALHRQQLLADPPPPTALTRLFSGRPARGIVNRLMRELGPLSELPPAFPTASTALAPLRAAAEAAGCSDFTPLWAGQNTTGCRQAPAAAIVQRLVQGMALQAAD